MSKTKFEESHAHLNSKISNVWHQNLETIYLHLFTPFNRFNCSEDFSLSTFLNLGAPSVGTGSVCSCSSSLSSCETTGKLGFWGHSQGSTCSTLRLMNLISYKQRQIPFDFEELVKEFPRDWEMQDLWLEGAQQGASEQSPLEADTSFSWPTGVQMQRDYHRGFLLLLRVCFYNPQLPKNR